MSYSKKRQKVKNYNPPQPQRYDQQSKHKNNRSDNQIFSDNFMDFVGIIAKGIGQGGIMVILVGLSLSSVTIDIGTGALALTLSFAHDISLGSFAVTSSTIAWALSWVTSGIQVFMRVRWVTKRGRVSNREEYIMYGIMGADSFLDATAFYYLLTGISPRNFTFSGLTFVDLVIILLGTGACFISENLVVYLASMRTNNKSLMDLLKGDRR